MKKRLFSIFAVSLLLVAVISASAFGATNYKPTFSVKASDANETLGAIPYNTAMTTYTISITSHSKDISAITTDYAAKNKNTIDGIIVEVTGPTNGEGSVKISGTATEVVKNKSFTITAKGKGGTSTLKLKLTVDPGSTAVAITAPTTGVPTGYVKKGATASATFTAAPGPVTWKTKNLPKGLTAKENSSGGLDISGSYSAVTDFTSQIGGDPKKNEYEITAQNKAITGDAGKATYTNTVIVYDDAGFKTTSLKDITCGKPYSAKIDFINYPLSVTVGGGITEATAGTAFTNNEFQPDSSVSNQKCGTLTWDPEKRTLSGTFNYAPKDGYIYVQFKPKTRSSATGADGTAKTYAIKVNSIAPAWGKPDATVDTTGITVGLTKGTPPFTVSVYIDKATAKNLGATDKITLASGTADATYSGLTWTADTTPADGYVYSGKLKYTNSEKVAGAFKGLKVTFEATNAATSKAVSKAFGFNYNTDSDAQWRKTSKTGDVIEDAIVINAQDGTYVEDGTFTNAKKWLAAGEEIPAAVTTAATYYVDVPKPFTVTGTGEKNGVKATFTENDSLVKITGTPTAGKDTTTKFKLVASNPVSKQKATLNVTVQAYADPVVSNTTELTKGKTVAVGKAVSIKSKIKGHKDILPTITWTAKTATDISKPGLTLETDSDKGTFEIVGAAGSTKPTLDSNSTKYQATTTAITMKTANDATGKDVNVKIDIKPVEPKFATKKITITRGTTPTVVTNTGDTNGYIEFSNIAAADTSGTTPNAKLAITSTPEVPGVAIAVGSTAGTDAHVGKLTLTADKLVAGKTDVNVTVTNYGTSSVKKKVTIQVNDPKPVIKKPDGTFTPLEPTATAAAESDVTFTVTTGVTGTADLKWKISTKPDGLKAKIKSSSKTQCVVTITAPKKLAEAASGNVGLQAQNTLSKEWSDEVTYAVSAKAAPAKDSATKDGEALETDKATDEATEPMKEEEVEVGEGKVISGKARTEAALTATQRTRIAEAGYVVVAVLPEVEVTAPGQYPLPVEIPEEIAAGKELAWFAFSTKPSEDDEIVDFFDEEGKDTKVVPESHKITVYPWLNADVTYAPVIAVKADAGEKGAETEEQIKEKTVRAVKK